MPGINRRPTKSEYLGRAAAVGARLVMGALDGDRRGSRFPPSPTNCATYFGNAVAQAAPDDLGPEYSSTVGQGFTVEELFAAIASKFEPELVMAGHELLGEMYLRVEEDIATAKGVPDVPKIVADVLVRDVDELAVDGDGLSLWCLFMLKCYADSPYLALALQHSERVQPIGNPFAPWAKVPGTY